MRLDHEFTVPAPVERVWQAVLTPERVAPCMPGATLSEVDGNTFTGSVKVKLGPVNLLYKGSGEFQDKDEQAHRIVIKASGKDARGAGTASATVTVTLQPNGQSSTRGAVATELNVTGRPAQFGRGMISDVGGKILDSFAESLADELGGRDDTQQPTGTTGTETSESGQTGRSERSEDSGQPRLRAVPDDSEAEAIDLMEYAGSSVVRRVVPALAAVALLGGAAVLVKLLRDRKRGTGSCSCT